MPIAGTPLANYITEGAAQNTEVISNSKSCFKQQFCYSKRGARRGQGGDGGGQAVHMRLCLDMDQGFKTKP